MLKNPPVGRPIVAGYNWILPPASIFAGHFLKEFYCKFDGILTDSLSLVKILETTKFDEDCCIFTIDFKSLYTNIPIDDSSQRPECATKTFNIINATGDTLYMKFDVY